MRLLTRITDGLMVALAAVGGLGVLALMLHVVADVAMRNLFNRPIPATYEIVTSYYMILLAFVPLAWVERRGGMVAVEVLDGFMSPRALRVSDMLVATLSAVIYAALAWVTWQLALRSYATGTFLMAMNVRVPTWPGFFLPPAGFLLAALVTALRAAGRLPPPSPEGLAP